MDESTDRAQTVYRQTVGAPRPEQTLVVIGNGMMCWKLCQKLVECGANQVLEIVVFGEEPYPAYDRVHLTELLSGRTTESLLLAPSEWYAENNIQLYLGDPVIEIDREDCVVRSAKGHMVEYDRLVFATGSNPFVPPIYGVDLPGVFVYRTVEHVAEILTYGDSLAIEAAKVDEPARAAVIGGGLLGLEAAKAVYDLGLTVHVVEFAPGLMNRQLDAKGSSLLKERIEQLGVHVHLSKQTTKITASAPPAHAPDKPPRVLHFSDGGTLEVDMVIVSAGIRPRSDLAGASGLSLAKNGGIIVDDHLTTSDPRIFAVGECAIHRGMTYGLALPGYRMVEILVDNLVGGTAAFEGTDQSAKLKLMGVAVASLGQGNEKDVPNATAELYVGKGDRGEQVYRKLVLRDGRIIGCIAVGEWANLDRIREVIEQPRTVSLLDRLFRGYDLRRFRGAGTLFEQSESPPIAEWAADALVCGCLHVTRGTLSQAQLNGCATVEDLCARTGAGTMCGSCKPLLSELLGGSRDSVPPSMREPAAPSSMRGAPVSRRSLMTASKRKPVSLPPPPALPTFEPISFARHTPTPILPVMTVATPTPVVAPPAAAEAPIEEGPLSQRGSMLPQVSARRASLRPSSVRVEPAPPLRHDVDSAAIDAVPTASAATPASNQVSFRPPERISFTKNDPLDDEEPAPISVRVPSASNRPPSTSKRPTSVSNLPPSTSRRLASIGPVAVRERDGASGHDPILPPDPGTKGDSTQPPPDSSPPSLRDFLPPSVRDTASLQMRDVGSRLMREAAASLSRDLDRTPARAPEGPVPDASNSSSYLDEAPPPSRRRDSMPPLRPITVPPVRGSVAPGRISAAPGRISSAPRSQHPPEPGANLLFGASIGTLVVAVVVAAVGPISPAGSTHGLHLDALWNTSAGKQTTGYAAVGLGLASLLLSLRKRFPKRFPYSEVPILRVVHASLGILTLVALAFHTGLHLGSHLNLNRILMIDFLALALLGAVSGGITARSHRFESAVTARDQKLLWFRAHLILFWPLPVLLALHILAAYYY